METNDGEIYGPDNDERVTHSVVVELLGVDDATRDNVAGLISDTMQSTGLVKGAHYQITVGSPLDLLSAMRPPSEGPSKSQIGYIQRLYGDCQRMLNMSRDYPEVDAGVKEVAAMVLETTLDEMRRPYSKRRAGQFIDALRACIDDLRAEMSGL